jgi:hypothetical protein
MLVLEEPTSSRINSKENSSGESTLPADAGFLLIETLSAVNPLMEMQRPLR